MSAVVLMYHRVAAPEIDPYGLAVRPDHFAEHVERLAALGCVVPLADAVRSRSAATVAITFDDGYADNAGTAQPLLASAGLPATWFITTGTLGGRRFWWDRLAAALLGEHPLPGGVDVAVQGRNLWLSLGSDADREASLRFLHRRLRMLPPAELAAAVDDLLARLGAPEPPADELTMTVEQLRAMAASPLNEIGAHTRTHLQLGVQSVALQRDEIAGSVADLQELLDRPVTSFAFPFGTRDAVGAVAPRLAQEAGCTLACSTRHGAVEDGSDPHRLPRLNVLDWPADELERQIRALVDLGRSGEAVADRQGAQ